jgi:hypothetical protein
MTMLVADQIEFTNAVPWETFEQGQRYKSLTLKQRVWLIAYMVSGSTLWAALMAYRCKSVENARVLGYELKKNHGIQQALAEFTGKSERDIFIEELKDTLRCTPKNSTAHSKAQALYARLMFGVEPEAAEPVEVRDPAEPKPFVARVGDIVLVSGLKHRVTAIDENGRPTDAEPL